VDDALGVGLMRDQPGDAQDRERHGRGERPPLQVCPVEDEGLDDRPCTEQCDEAVQGPLTHVVADRVARRGEDHDDAPGDEQPLQGAAGPHLADDHEEPGDEEKCQPGDEVHAHCCAPFIGWRAAGAGWPRVRRVIARARSVASTLIDANIDVG
jgi:hypothetical protein